MILLVCVRVDQETMFRHKNIKDLISERELLSGKQIFLLVILILLQLLHGVLAAEASFVNVFTLLLSL